MLLLKVQRAIAYIRMVMGVATPTHNAGLAHPEPTQPVGNSNSVQDTQRQSQPVHTQRSQSKERVQPDTPARKHGKKKPTARQVATVSRSQATGSKSQTTAPVKQAQSNSRSSAQRTTPAQSSSKEHTPVKAAGVRGRPRKTPV